jgi:hypothetical protein
MDELHKKFILKKTPLKYSIQEVKEFLQDNYSVKEIPPSEFEDLRKDLFVNFNDIVIGFEIDDPDILNHIFNENEKSFHHEYRKEFEEDATNSTWNKLRAGELLRVILESDELGMLSSFTVQGMCMNLVYDLTILKGIPSGSAHLGNEEYQRYLELLKLRGKL